MVIAKSKKSKPQMNNTIKKMDYTWSPGPEPPNNQEVSVPRAVFIPHADSLPFEERHVTLEQPVKIGRNVYRVTPTPTNTIFECRVLSRHHATLYYDKGHFYLVDNQSSNGTFINSTRCSISKEQEPHEVFSGDVVQFGIPVVENNGDSEKNTFPPVVALLKLFHSDGKEAKQTFNPTMTTPLHLKELYQLNNYVQEAIQREACLESRIRTLRECLEQTKAEAAGAWELFVGEQRLLMRVRTLESMVAVGRQPEQRHLDQLINDKKNYQEVAQESLRLAHEQRLALEESLERRTREAAALHHHNCALRLAANNALAELQKLASRCERKMCAAKLAIAAAEEREATVKTHLPLAYWAQNGEAKMLILSTDTHKVTDRRGTIEDAVRALPDYVKLLLPQHLLNKIGMKILTNDGKSPKEFELILKKNNLYEPESKEESNKLEETKDDVGVSNEEKSASETTPADLCTDDEKQSRLNHDSDVEPSSPLDGELLPDNNANSTYSDPSTREDSPSKCGAEMANILRVMAGLNEEIRALRTRLTAAQAETEQLRAVRDELLAARPEEESPAPALRATVHELQAQLSRTTVAEEANVAEIQRLAANAAELQVELSLRPTRADVDSLTAVVGSLHEELKDKNQLIQRLQADLTPAETCEVATDTRDASPDSPEQEEQNLSVDIDEIFRLDGYEDDDTTDSLETEQYVRVNDEERVKNTISNGSIHALEEELVRTKEMWREASSERARLAEQLAVLNSRRPISFHALAIALLALLAALIYALLPQIS